MLKRIRAALCWARKFMTESTGVFVSIMAVVVSIAALVVAMRANDIADAKGVSPSKTCCHS